MTAPKTVYIYPSPDLPTGTFLPGIGAEGAEVPYATATGWIKAGLATKEPPSKKKPAEPAKEVQP